MRITKRGLLGGIAAAVACPLAASSQGTGGSTRIIYPFALGGSGDAIARFIADKLGKALNQTTIVENKTGADGRIGIRAVKNAAPDGATLLVTSGPSMTYMPIILDNPGYNPGFDFEPISLLGRYEFCIVAANNTGIRSIVDLISWATANPGIATYSVPALGSIPHVAGVALAKKAGISLQHVAYRGVGSAINDIISGQLPLGFTVLADVLQHHKSGTLRIIATMSRVRSSFLPDIPTLIEQGYPIEAEAWFGLWAPTKTPKSTIDAIYKVVQAALGETDARERFMAMGLILDVADGAKLEQMRKDMTNQWDAEIRSSGFKLEN